MAAYINKHIDNIDSINTDIFITKKKHFIVSISVILTLSVVNEIEIEIKIIILKKTNDKAKCTLDDSLFSLFDSILTRFQVGFVNNNTLKFRKISKIF